MNFKLGTWMKDDDPHHQHARRSSCAHNGTKKTCITDICNDWKLWVAVQVTTCRGWGHYGLHSLLHLHILCFVQIFQLLYFFLSAISVQISFSSS